MTLVSTLFLGTHSQQDTNPSLLSSTSLASKNRSDSRKPQSLLVCLAGRGRGGLGLVRNPQPQ